jgi:hypothetical protein
MALRIPLSPLAALQLTPTLSDHHKPTPTCRPPLLAAFYLWLL